jgi:hypothetical protein
MGGDSAGTVWERGGDVKVGWVGSAGEKHPAVRAAAARIRRRFFTCFRRIFQVVFIIGDLQYVRRVLSIPKQL